eukprot:1101327-Pyramimonas_sp.AAC.1
MLHRICSDAELRVINTFMAQPGDHTFSTHEGELHRIDYIIGSEAFHAACQSTEVCFEFQTGLKGPDHFPLLANFEWTNKTSFPKS